MAKAAATKTAARPRRTRTEVEEAFESVKSEVAAARETADAKREEAERREAAGLRASLEGTTVETVASRLSGLSLEVTRALANLADQCLQEVRTLENLRKAVALETAELERIHKIDVAATALDQLVQDYQRESERLEAEMKARRAQWEEEVRNTERERKREIEDYEYKKAVDRKKERDKYEEEQRQLERRNKDRQEQLERSWAEREAALKEREQELKHLRAESESFPARLREATEQAARDATQTAETRFSQEILLAQRDRETEKRLAELQVKSLEATIARQSEQLAAMQKQLDEAKVQVQEIAVRAIEGASGAKALTHVNQIAIEQAKHRPQS